MARPWIGALLGLVTLASRGEHIEATYREGAALALTQTDSLSMEADEVSVSVNDVELPPEALEQMGMPMPSMHQETSIRQTDVVVAAKEGRPTRVRRTFEHLRQHSVEEDEEKDKTGPLEGRTLVLAEDDGEVVAELEKDEEPLDDVYLRGHRLTSEADLLLPDGEVAVGDEWHVEDEALREFLSMDSGPVLFEPDEDEKDNELFDKLFTEGSTVGAKVTFVAIEEHQGLRCAALAFTIDFHAELNDPAALGIEPEEGMEPPSGGLEAEISAKGKLWYALAEGRPVSMEQSLEGTMAFHFAALQKVEGNEIRMKIEVACTLEGESTSTWSPPE